MRSTNETKRLGLSSIDVKIITALHKRGLTKPVDLAIVINDVPRTTLTYRLTLLLARGWVEKKKVAGHFEWCCSQAARELVNDTLVTNELIVAHHPLNQVPHILEALFKDSSNERIYFLEPTVATASVHQEFGNDFLTKMALLFKAGKNISEGVTSDALLGYLKHYSQKTLKEMHGRMVVIHLVPDDLLHFEDMFIVYRDSVYIINPKKDHVTQVKDASFAASIKTTIQALQYFGKKIDLNSEIEKLLNS